jgi:hypothetical protein
MHGRSGALTGAVADLRLRARTRRHFPLQWALQDPCNSRRYAAAEAMGERETVALGRRGACETGASGLIKP